MAFTSASFIVLTIASVLLYYIVPKKAQWCILLLASAAFYMAGSVKAFAWVVLVSGMTWVTGLILGRYNAIKPADKAQKAQIQHKKKQIAIICAVCCFGLLYAMKYWNFTLELLPSALGNHIPRWDFVVPLGLSFFIFQSMSYVIDVYRGKYAPERNPLRYGLFVSFFPQMVQGPISRFDQLAPQLTAERKLCWDDLQIGIQLALWGYFKKIVIADRAAVLVNNVIMENCPYGGAVIALGILFYCIQLYCDFSGGIDITRGVARMFGIDMTLNFRRPLFSTSLTDYWRRWHITLGAWMRDYVFYPLALSRPFRALGSFARKRFRGMLSKIFATSMATFVVYFIIGVWHGANFRYLAFGLYNGVLITAALLLEPLFVRVREKLPIRWDGWAWHSVQMLRTGVIVFIGRYITRAPRLTTALSMLRRSVTDFSLSQLRGGAIFSLGMTRLDWLVVLAGLFVLLAVEVYQERGGRARALLARQTPAVQGLVTLLWLAALLLLGALGGYTGAGFIYAQY